MHKGLAIAGLKVFNSLLGISKEICILAEIFGSEIPAIAKPQTVTCNHYETAREQKQNIHIDNNYHSCDSGNICVYPETNKHGRPFCELYCRCKKARPKTLLEKR